VNHVITYHSIN